MIDPVQVRLNQLNQISKHCRVLAGGALPLAVSAEIARMADEYEEEAARIERVCRGKRTCPCECLQHCLPVH